MTAGDLALPRDLDAPGSIIDAIARLALRQGGVTRAGAGARGRRVVAISGAISLAVHVALALGFSDQSLRESGTIAQPTEAISIEFIATDVLEQAPSPDASASSAASPAALAPVEGTAPETTATAPPPTVEPTETDELQPVDPVTPRAIAEVPPSPETPTVPDVELLAATEGELPPEIADENPRQQTRRPDEKRRKPPDREPDTRKAPAKQKAGGVRSRGQTASKSAAGRVSASSGDISGYKARVLARLAAHRPAGRGFRGTAVVSFGISRSGGLTYARISRSSGNAAADQAAVASVRRAAPFPPPPAGATAGQLRFANPFYFR
jgi:protein TonB